MVSGGQSRPPAPPTPSDPSRKCRCSHRFCPSVFLYLASVCPSIWLIELEKLDKRLQKKEMAQEAAIQGMPTETSPMLEALLTTTATTETSTQGDDGSSVNDSTSITNLTGVDLGVLKDVGVSGREGVPIV